MVSMKSQVCSEHMEQSSSCGALVLRTGKENSGWQLQGL